MSLSTYVDQDSEHPGGPTSTLDNRVVLLTTYVEAAFFYEVKFFGQKEGAHLRSIYVVTLMTSRST